jgi:hypothetical protein
LERGTTLADAAAMRFVVAFVIAIAAAGCCGDDTTIPVSMPDLSMPTTDCPTAINEGQTCRPECHYLGDFCSCSASHVWTCHRPDMATHD